MFLVLLLLLSPFPAMQAVLTELAIFLGEPADADPAHSFGMVWSFVMGFDRAFVKVAQASFKDSALIQEIEEASAQTKKAKHKISPSAI